MTNRLDEVNFTKGSYIGKGYQEVNSYGNLVALYDVDGDQLPHENREWDMIKSRGEVNNRDDFWSLIEE